MEDDVPLQAAQSAAEVAHIEDVIKQEKVSAAPLSSISKPGQGREMDETLT